MFIKLKVSCGRAAIVGSLCIRDYRDYSAQQFVICSSIHRAISPSGCVPQVYRMEFLIEETNYNNVFTNVKKYRPLIETKLM